MGLVLNAVLLGQGLAAGVQPAGQRMRLGVHRQDGRERTHQLGGRAPPFPAFGHQLLYGSEEFVRVFARLLLAVLKELPVLGIVKLQA